MKSESGVSIGSYFKKEKKLLILTAITGIIYNVGMTAGPWFEGQLAQYLYDILKGIRAGRDIVILSVIYVAVIALVQGARALKRLYVRKFANNVSRSMKESIYHHLVHESYAAIQSENTGEIMTKAIADAEACAEGMRKFTTELFDTGVVMIAYLVMLFVLDWRLTLIVILFPPIAYAASAALKGKVTVSSAASKKAMAELNSDAVDAVGNALTYRIYGEDGNRAAAYEKVLRNYENKNVAAGIWQNSPQPVYLVLSMIGVIPILVFGGRNVLGTGWIVWTIASFSSFLSCFTKLAIKSSHAAKLFNAVQKAKVSWKRIEKYLVEDETPAERKSVEDDAAEGEQSDVKKGVRTERDSVEVEAPAELEMRHVSFSYEGKVENPGSGTEIAVGQSSGEKYAVGRRSREEDESEQNSSEKGGSAKKGNKSFSLYDLNFAAKPGQIVGITGRVASGKSTFGKLFLNEYPYEGRILYGGKDISSSGRMIFAYAGHDPELFTGTVRDNITFGRKVSTYKGAAYADARLRKALRMVQIEGEVTPETMAGMEGSSLSGGQQARIALARALYSGAPVLILDDPFAAVDRETEERIFRNLREEENDKIILLISHRMELFPQMDQILFIENGTITAGTHEEMMRNRSYAELYALQSREKGSIDKNSGTPEKREAGKPEETAGNIDKKVTGSKREEGGQYEGNGS